MNERTARVVLFIALSMTVLVGYPFVMRWLGLLPDPPVRELVEEPPVDDAEVADPERPDVAEEPAPERPDDEDAPRAPEIAAAPDRPEAPVLAAPDDVPLEYYTLGSVDPKSRHRVLATFTNLGAALERVEMASPQFRDIEDRWGYLGFLAPTDASNPRGALVQVVGDGTPAAEAGLLPGDIITAFGQTQIGGITDYETALRRTRPGQTIELSIVRDGVPRTLSTRLIRIPLSVIAPEEDSPPSLLMTLEQLDGQRIGEDEDELPGLTMRTGNWEVVEHDQDRIAFRWVIPSVGIEVIKRFTVATVPREAQDTLTYPAYHLDVELEIRNLGDAARQVAYRLEGPNGLPTEGAWYAYKISPHWFESIGLRDVVVGWYQDGYVEDKLYSCLRIAEEGVGPIWTDRTMAYIGVDAQYFNSSLVPQKAEPGDHWIDVSRAIRVGPMPLSKSDFKLGNSSFRIESTLVDLEPGGEAIEHHYRLFVGPKEPHLLAHYGLDGVIYYGWFWWVAKPMLAFLHFIYGFVHNYGLAIILLTVVVRSAMFPVSRKQALNAMKMQELQPEIKRIAEKYKNNVEQRTKAQQDLFKKHNYNPLGGCLIMFIQLPIFIGLYRSLSVDVHLRQAPLISEAIRWCSNLAAPDMLFPWAAFMPGIVVNFLGPYFNILPLATVALFLAQQKMFMPPPTDDQTRMQQKIMQYMMIFIGFMFFKVASGLCIYFIASSVWGLAERKLLPKKDAPTTTTAADASKKIDAKSLIATLTGSGNGATRSKQKPKSKPRGRR